MTEWLPLSLWRNRAPEHRVAVEQGRWILQSELEARVAAWMVALPAQGGQRWAVYHENTFEFLCMILALWQLKCTACIPADNRPGTIERLAANLDGFVGEFDAGDVLQDPEPVEMPVSWGDLDAGQIALEIYTSGSTGAPKSIDKTLGQIEREIETIENCWPSQPNVVLSTVSHQHLYGMTFALFWPVCTGRPFESRCCELIEEIHFRAGHYDRFALVSSPSHLSRFGSLLDWRSLAGSCDYLLSSAAPLARGDSLVVGSLLQSPVREIYGSSETGAIAWRIQREDVPDASWQALPGVDLMVTGDHQLRVSCAYLGDLDFYDLPDRVEQLDDGSFRLLGRIDSIVKVEGKRVSLSAIEAKLNAHPWVNQAKALILEKARVETAIVMQLSEEGVSALSQQGKRALIEVFKNLLLHDFELVVVPRRWRFVDRLPYNRQGKLPLENLRNLFLRGPVLWPEIIEQEIVDDWLVLSCRIPEALLYFDGHMPGHPILPGVVQVHWAESYGRELLRVQGAFRSLEVLKFQQIILPESRVNLSLAYDADKNKLAFRYESDQGVHSSGRICFVS